MIKRLLQNRMSYLSLSFLLFVAALPLISFGTAGQRPILFWLGFISMGIAAAIPPVQRMLYPPKKS